MHSVMRVGLTFAWLVMCCASPATAGDAKPVNLLRIEGASLDEAGSSGQSKRSLEALADGDRSTTTTVTATEGTPLTVVYGFADATVSPERLIVTLPKQSEKVSPAARVELLVSTISPHAGFQSVRSDPLKAETKPQQFRFVPVGARWVMLRFVPAPGAKQVSIAEVELLGHEGPPVTRYQFKESPAKAFDVLKRLEKTSSLGITISKDEASLFDDARDGKLDEWSFAEAALLASGVQDRAQRKKFLAEIDQITNDARTATEKSRSPFAKGEALLKYLHSGPMSKGYASKQTDLSGVLATGKFNCVSSATTYNVVGRRLGLDLRAIEVPNHAFSILYEGTKHADVETTTPGGFNPARDKRAQAEFQKLTGFAYIPDSDRDQRREIGEVGLTAIICYNHGVGLTAEKRYHEALLAYFRAMSLDPEFDSAVKNALAVLANWGVELARDKQYEQALNVVGTGLALAPQDATLVNNRKAVWQQWADSLMKDDRDDEALAVLRRAHEAVPEGNFEKMQAWVFISKGERAIKAGDWDQAASVVEPGLNKLDGDPRQELEEWGRGLNIRRSNAAIKAGRFNKAFDVLELALADTPDDEKLANQLAYAVQEAAWKTYKKAGREASQQTIADVMPRFGKHEDVRDVARGHFSRVVRDLVRKKKYDEARAAAQRAGTLLGDAQFSLELSRAAIDGQARDLVKRKDWQSAVDVYTMALQEFPGDEHLERNLGATWDQWTRSYSRDRNWAMAIDVNAKALEQASRPERATNNIPYFIQEWTKAVYANEGAEAAEQILAAQMQRFSDMEGLQRIAQGHTQRVARDLISKEKYNEALAAVERSANLLEDDEAVNEVAGFIYGRWADTFIKKSEWKQAVGVYREALKKYPNNSRIEQNAAATWYRWAKTHMDAKDWAGAVRVYEESIEVFPENSVLKNNLEYCKQQLQKQKT